MLKKILLGLVVIIVILLGVIAMRPDTTHIQRSVAVQAPAEVVFAQINDFHNWNAWSPWAKLDPQQKTTFSGAPVGVGSVYHWAGNDQVGEGEMKVTANKPSQSVTVDLHFMRPFDSQAKVDFTIAQGKDGVQVTWGFDTKNNFMSKAFGLFMDMDKMLGSDFEKGLAGIKTVSETEAKRLAAEKAAAEKAAAEKAAAEKAAAEAAAAPPAGAVAEVK